MSEQFSTSGNIWMQDNNEQDKTIVPFWSRSKGFGAVLFLLITSLVAILGYLGSGGNFATIEILGKSGFVVDKTILLLLSIVGFLMAANAIIVANNDTSKEKEAYAKTNTILYFVQIVLFAFWPLFFYSIESALISSIVLFFSICLSIYILYRFYPLSLYAGILYSIWTIWQLFVFVVNFATFLTA